MKRFAILLSIVLRVSACAEPTDPMQPFAASVSATADAGWSATASMLETRYSPAAASGVDGRIYVFSGLRRAVLTSAEVYDPAQNTWNPIAAPGGQAAAGAVRGSDGRIYLVGGVDEAFSPLKKVQAYDPQSDTWTAVADMNNQRYAHGVAVGADGRVYAFGGTVNGFEALKSAEVSDVAMTQWTHIAQMSVERQAFGAAAGRDGRIYVFGGLTNQAATAASEVYDPRSDTWSPIASMPQYRFGHAAVRGADGLLYVFGGRMDGIYENTVFAYNPATDSWSVLASMSSARYMPAAAAGNDGYVYVIGGKATSTLILSSVERYLTALPNRPPVASAGPDQTVECVAGCGHVTLDASASSDPDGDALSYEWFENGELVARGPAADLQLNLGSHTFMVRVGDQGAFSEDEVVVNVVDTQAPVIAFNQLLPDMRPVNHTLRLAAVVSATDACDASAVLEVSVSSNEPENGTGDGDTAPDWQILPTDNGIEVWVRAERSGGGNGRVYTITATATDRSGNQSSARGTVTVTRVPVKAFTRSKTAV